jgi:hypothetical protein
MEKQATVCVLVFGTQLSARYDEDMTELQMLAELEKLAHQSETDLSIGEKPTYTSFRTYITKML